MRDFHADGDAGGQGQGRDEDADEERILGPVDQAREDIAPERIRAQRMLRAGRGEHGREIDSLRIEGGNLLGEDGAPHHHQHRQ